MPKTPVHLAPIHETHHKSDLFICHLNSCDFINDLFFMVPHWHNYPEIVFCLSGSATIYVGRDSFCLSCGQAVFIGVNDIHFGAVEPREQCVVIPFVLTGGFQRYVRQQPGQLPACAALFQEGACPPFQIQSKRALQYLKDAWECAFQRGACEKQRLFMTLLLALECASVEGDRDSAPDGGASELMRRLLSYINAHAERALSLEELARAHYISTVTLHRLFKQFTGSPPARFIRSVRLKKALLRIASGEGNVEQAALACGFANSSHFIRRFKQQYGLTPMQYRQKNSADAPWERRADDCYPDEGAPPAASPLRVNLFAQRDGL